MKVQIEKSWSKVLEMEFEKAYFSSLVTFVRDEYKHHPKAIFPKGNQIFRAFDACPFDKVKVVILGQDPYPTRGHAHGLCFSVEPDLGQLPKSLINIYKELQNEGIDITSRNGDLTHWAEQGVLLLNAVLTVREGAPESHAGRGWETFTDAVIEALNHNKKGIVYLLWGSKALQKAAKVDNKNNLILHSPHPSPLSAHRGFFGCGHFLKTNQYLKEQGNSPINW